MTPAMGIMASSAYWCRNITQMTYFIDPDGFGRFQRAAKAAMKDANGQHLRAILVGYNVSPSTGAELGDYRVHPARLGHEPTTSFIVRRIDQTPEDGQTFGTVEAVRQYVIQVGARSSTNRPPARIDRLQLPNDDQRRVAASVQQTRILTRYEIEDAMMERRAIDGTPTSSAATSARIASRS
jgi:hypothetical protein